MQFIKNNPYAVLLTSFAATVAFGLVKLAALIETL